MKKIRLELERLYVESFVTASAHAAGGTVLGHAAATAECPSAGTTCHNSCQYHCFPTLDPSCDC